MLKKILIFLVVIVVALAAFGFLLPSSYSVERSVVIEAQPAAVFPYLNNLRRWEEWTPWTTEKHPKMEMSYSGPEEGVGAKSSWTDPESGNGELVITQSDPEKGIVYDLLFEGYSKSEGSIQMEENPAGVRVTMTMEGDIGNNPFARYVGLFMDSLLGKDFEEGLAKLKSIVEKGKPTKVPEEPAARQDE